MAFVPVYGFIAATTGAISPSAGLIPIDSAVASAFATQLGSGFTFASLSDGTNYEIVKITSVSSANLVVVRGQDDTTASAFPMGTCLRFIWEEQGIAAIVGALPAVTITGIHAAVVTNPSANHWVVDVPVPIITGTAPNCTVTGSYPTWSIAVTIPPGCC
jgi:hypothetical protein